MIKTVSFSPPRSSSRASSRSASRVSARTASEQPTLDFSAPEIKPEVKPKETKKKAATKAEVPVAKPEKAVSAKKAVAKVSAAEPKAKVSTEPKVTTEPTAKVKAEPKARRPRVPANLAEQYGATQARRIEKPLIGEEEGPKKRLTKAEREARKALMRPNEELLQRLQRIETVPLKKKSVQPKARGWRFECGCCGRVTHFQTIAALCECGAIAVKE